MVNSRSVPPSCREVPRQCSWSYTARPQAHAYSPWPGLGDSMLLVTFDFFHVFVKEVFLWHCFYGEIIRGPACWLENFPASRQRRTSPCSPHSRAGWDEDGFTSVQGIRKAPIPSQHERNRNSEPSESAGRDNCHWLAPPGTRSPSTW